MRLFTPDFFQRFIESTLDLIERSSRFT